MSTGNRSRHVFHQSDVPAFVAWAKTLGYIQERTKGEYEALRLRRDREIIVYYRRELSSYLTIHDEGANLFWEWRDAATKAEKIARKASKRAAKKAAEAAAQ